MKTEIPETVILGIDPGTNLMGYGVLRVSGNSASLVAMGVLDMRKMTEPYEKLDRIFSRVASLIDEFHAGVLAIEAPFMGKNVQSMLKLGRAQGVAIAAAAHRGVHIQEYKPLEIKMAITGNGGASKEQVADMLRRFLRIREEDIPDKLDATDALGAAYCYYLRMNRPQAQRPLRGWKEFVEKNKDRVSGLKK